MRPSLSGDLVQSFKGEDAQLARRLRNHLVASRSMQTKSERTVRRIDQARPSSLCASRCSQLPRPTPFWVVRQTAQTISSETLPDLKLAVAENDSRSVSRMLDIMCGCTLSRRPRARADSCTPSAPSLGRCVRGRLAVVCADRGRVGRKTWVSDIKGEVQATQKGNAEVRPAVVWPKSSLGLQCCDELCSCDMPLQSCPRGIPLAASARCDLRCASSLPEELPAHVPAPSRGLCAAAACPVG